MTPRTPRSAEQRLQALSALQDGWLDGQGKSPGTMGLQTARSLIEALPELGASAGIFPTLRGGIQFETDAMEIHIRKNGKITIMDVTDSSSFSRSFSRPGTPEEVGEVVQVIGKLLSRDPDVTSPPARSEREAQLESLIRRMLPQMRAPLDTDPGLRRDLCREFTELRGMGYATDAVCTKGRGLFEFDGYAVLAEGEVNGRPAFLMLMPDNTEGFDTLVAVPRTPVFESVKAGDLCLRTALLDPDTHLYTGSVAGEAFHVDPMKGALHEFMLPSPGLMLDEFYPTPASPGEEMEVPA